MATFRRSKAHSITAMNILPIADLENILGIMIPIIALMIPIVAILVSHQQKMAQMIHGRPEVNNQLGQQLHDLQQELRSLRDLTAQNTLALDDVRKRLDSAPASEDSISDRLKH